jgi:hypothetical protein
LGLSETILAEVATWVVGCSIAARHQAADWNIAAWCAVGHENVALRNLIAAFRWNKLRSQPELQSLPRRLVGCVAKYVLAIVDV